MSEFPVILATECKMQTDSCTGCWRISSSIVLFSPHTPPEHLHPPRWDGQEEREGSSLKPNSRSCCPRPQGEEAHQEGRRWQSRAEKEAAALKGIRGGNRKESLTERHGKNKTPGNKENGIKDRSKKCKCQKLHRESGRKGSKGTG